MTLPQSINSRLRINPNESVNRLKDYQSFLSEFKAFLNETNRRTLKGKSERTEWNREFSSRVSEAYSYLNGLNGYSAPCHTYAIGEPIIALAMEYMGYMDRAFGCLETQDCFDPLFSPRGQRTVESYDDCCQKLYECHETIFEYGFELVTRSIIDLFKQVQSDIQSGQGKETYTLEVNKKTWGPVPEWFYDRQNLYVLYCLNIGGLYRHLAHAIGIDREYRVTVDYDREAFFDKKIIRIRVKRHMRFARCLNYRHQITEDGIPLDKYFIATDTGQRIWVSITPFFERAEVAVCQEAIELEEELILDDRSKSRINRVLASYCTLYRQ